MSTTSTINFADLGPTGSATTPAKTATASKPDPLADKSVFLQLLVAQLKNQNPLSPADGVQFVTQLAQFSGLEQSTEMNSSLKSIKDLLSATPAPGATTPTSSTK